MKKLNVILLFVCFHFSQITHTQEQCITDPNSFGTYIGELFLNKKDIKNAPFYTKEFYEKWKTLTKSANDHNLKSPNFKYHKTYFFKGSLNPEYTLYLTFKSKTEIIAIQIEVTEHNNKWSINKIHPSFYTLINKRKNIERFIPNEWIKEDSFYPQVAAAPYPVEEKKKMFSLPKDKKKTCITNPTIILDNYIKQLLSNSKIESFSNIITFNDYEKTYISSFLTSLNKEKTNDPGDLKEINYFKKMLVEEPKYFYNRNFTSSILEIANYVKTNEYYRKDIKKIEYVIQNFNNQILGEGKLVCIVDIILDKKGKQEGIRCSAIWHDNTWKIIHQQKHTYGISNAQ